MVTVNGISKREQKNDGIIISFTREFIKVQPTIRHPTEEFANHAIYIGCLTGMKCTHKYNKYSFVCSGRATFFPTILETAAEHQVQK